MIRSASQSCKNSRKNLPKLPIASKPYLNSSSYIKPSTALKTPKRPRISSESWILSTSSGRTIDSQNAGNIREFASLSKIMTCIVVIEEVMKSRRSFYEVIHVSEMAVNIIGTKAGLLSNDALKVWDLLHGLMLPSGNDAALALAEYIGKIYNPSEPVTWFIAKMNELAKSVKMDMTCFNNPHGLSNFPNRSTARNLVSLVNYAMGNMMFRKIVAKKTYECLVYGEDGPRKVVWENTNKLLDKGFTGVKTGFTPNAGPCLAASYEKNGRKFVVVLLSSKTMTTRWSDAIKLVKWGMQESLF